MSNAVFSALVQLTTAEFRVGLDRNNEYTNCGVICFSGILDEFKDIDSKCVIVKDKTTQVFAEVYFNDDIEMHSGQDLDGNKYIGKITIIKGEKEQLYCDLNVDLPFSMFHTLSSMRGKDVRIESVQDLIPPANENYQTAGHVRQVSFKFC